jgi:hypothetical protein
MLKFIIEWSSFLLLPLIFLTYCTQDDPIVWNGRINGQNKKVEGVAGQITDTAGRAIAGAAVQPKSLDDPSPPIPEIAIVSNGEGRYTWRLQPGNYEISVSVEGYKGATKRVSVKATQQTTLNFVLERAR